MESPNFSSDRYCNRLDPPTECATRITFPEIFDSSEEISCPKLYARIGFIRHSRVAHVVVWAERALQRVCKKLVFGVRAVAPALNEKPRRCSFPSNRTDGYIVNAKAPIDRRVTPELLGQQALIFLLPQGWLIGE